MIPERWSRDQAGDAQVTEVNLNATIQDISIFLEGADQEVVSSEHYEMLEDLTNTK